MDQRICKADHARFVQRLGRAQAAGCVHAGKRQECGTAKFILLQKCDHPFGGLLVICNDVLDAAAQRRLNGALIFFVRLNDIGYNPDQAFFFIPVCHDPADAVPVPVIAFCNVLERFQPRRLTVVCGLSDPEFLLFFIQFLLISLDLLFIFRDLLIIGPDRFTDLLKFILVLLQPLEQSFRFLTDLAEIFRQFFFP